MALFPIVGLQLEERIVNHPNIVRENGAFPDFGIATQYQGQLTLWRQYVKMGLFPIVGLQLARSSV